MSISIPRDLPDLATAPPRGEQDPEKEKLRKACQEMEGYFVGMLLKQMHRAAMKGGLFEEKSESATYREMFDEAVAAEIGKRGSFGIADTLFRDISRRFDAAREPDAAAPGHTAASGSAPRVIASGTDRAASPEEPE